MLFKSLQFLQILPLTLVVAAPLGGYVHNGVVVRDAFSADTSAVAGVSLLVDMLQQTLNVARLAIGTVFRTFSSI